MKNLMLILILFTGLNAFNQTIKISCEPGVAVALDNVPQGVTTEDGFTIKNVSKGNHILSFHKAGFTSISRDVFIKKRTFKVNVEASEFIPKASEKIEEIFIIDEEEGEADAMIFMVVEKMPVYKPQKCKTKAEGDVEVQKFIAENIKYPEEAIKKKIQGKVYASFVVDESGKVVDVKIIRGVHPLLDAEAKRVISLLQDFSPGVQRGKNVKVMFNVPINFKL